MKNIKTSKELIDTFSKELENIAKKNKNHQVLHIYDKWEKIIGDENLSTKCELEDIKNNTLIIKTKHTGWSQQILIKKKAIINNFNKIYPELKISSISIFVEPDSELKLFNESPENASNKLEKEKIDINHDLGKNNKEILNPELKDALERLKKTIQKKNKKN